LIFVWRREGREGGREGGLVEAINRRGEEDENK